jgi:alpha-L-rhamnosidase
VTQGATTSWEVWRNKSIEQTLDHPFLGSFDEWLFQHLAGIQAATPGYTTIRIAPVFADGLDHVSASIVTPVGRVSSAWKRVGGKVQLDIELPQQRSSEIALPAAVGKVRIISGNAKPVANSAATSVFATTSQSLVVEVDLAPTGV